MALRASHVWAPAVLLVVLLGILQTSKAVDPRTLLGAHFACVCETDCALINSFFATCSCLTASFRMEGCDVFKRFYVGNSGGDMCDHHTGGGASRAHAVCDGAPDFN